MCHAGPSRCRCSGGSACIGKEVQDADGTAGSDAAADQRGKPVPVDGLFREKACVLEAEGFEAEGEAAVPDAPVVREIKEFPFTAAFFTAVVVGVGFSPLPAAGVFQMTWGSGRMRRYCPQRSSFSPMEVSITS